MDVSKHFHIVFFLSHGSKCEKTSFPVMYCLSNICATIIEFKAIVKYRTSNLVMPLSQIMIYELVQYFRNLVYAIYLFLFLLFCVA